MKWGRRRQKQVYMKHVPKCCSLNWKQHVDMLFCWGVLESIKSGKHYPYYRCICDMSIYKIDRDKFKDIMKESTNVPQTDNNSMET